MRDVYELTNQELEDCINGTTDLDMVRDIFTKAGVVNIDGFLDEERFADWFAYNIENFITADEGTAEYDEAWDTNYNWGFTIAENINNYIDTDE